MIRILILILAALLPWHSTAAEPLTFVDGTAYFGAAHRFTGAPVVDDWTFTLSAPATANASLISIALSAGHSRHAFKIDSADLLGDGFAAAFDRMPAATTDPQVWTLQPTFLQAGDYAIRITGYVPTGAMSGSYAGTINVSPVPEPSALALSAAGLLAVGWVAYRRRPKK
jgi:hypothetical protein